MLSPSGCFVGGLATCVGVICAPSEVSEHEELGNDCVHNSGRPSGLTGKEPGQEVIYVLESVGHGGIEVYGPHM